jgi:hypothetical protein
MLVLAGCGHAAAGKAAPYTAPLTTSLVTGQGSWAILDMGGDQHFWQVFFRPADRATWSLVTPPGVADNGGLVSAGTDRTLLVGFRPSADLAFSPLASTADAGHSWAPDVLGARLAAVPDALAAGPGGQQAALLTDGTIRTGADGRSWARTSDDLATSAAARQCGVLAVSALSFWPGRGLVAGASCARPGVAGVFTEAGGGWRAAGPALPARYGGARVTTLRLGGGSALLLAGGDLLASWPGLSAPLPAGPGGVLASGFGPGGEIWVLLAGGRAARISPNGEWQSVPRVPSGTTALAGHEALAVSGSVLTVWRLAGSAWAKAPVLTVPINNGSSG